MYRRRFDLINLKAMPARDIPLRPLFQMCKCMLSSQYMPIGEETEYFWHQQSWVLGAIPDPRDLDPILACLVEDLVTAINWWFGLGMSRRISHS